LNGLDLLLIGNGPTSKAGHETIRKIAGKEYPLTIVHRACYLHGTVLEKAIITQMVMKFNVY
jgi:hypothetical protein